MVDRFVARKKRYRIVFGFLLASLLNSWRQTRIVEVKSISQQSIHQTFESLERIETQPIEKTAVIPPLSSILDKDSGVLIGDPQFLLDYAIVGHGKCGTTSMMQWFRNLGGQVGVHIAENEVLELSLGTQQEFISRLYDEFKQSPHKQLHGYKNPGEIRVPDAIGFLGEWFPKTVLIVGIRHPVLWFESLYNFKVQNLPSNKPSNYYGDPSTLIGECTDPKQFGCVGTHKGLFHVHLAMLGKTKQTEALERAYPSFLEGKITQTRNPVFLFDVGQLNEQNETRIAMFDKDLMSLLHVNGTSPVGSRPQISPGKTLDEKQQRRRDKGKIRICDSKYAPLREALMEISRECSLWIRTSGFLDNPDVHVTSREYFESILETEWMRDPCDNH